MLIWCFLSSSCYRNWNIISRSSCCWWVFTYSRHLSSLCSVPVRSDIPFLTGYCYLHFIPSILPKYSSFSCKHWIHITWWIGLLDKLPLLPLFGEDRFPGNRFINYQWGVKLLLEQRSPNSFIFLFKSTRYQWNEDGVFSLIKLFL